MRVLTAILVAVALCAVLYFIVPKVREWVRALWSRWFRDSEVNLFADVLSLLGVLPMVLDDPDLSSLLAQTGITPKWLLIIGIAVRLLRASRDSTMNPLRPLD